MDCVIVDSLSVDKKLYGRFEPAADSAFMVLRRQGNVKLDKECAKKAEKYSGLKLQ
ncbi:hypothetical protein [Neisseria sp. Marseille-Q2251]|uniref:hypothetical protein n=1 Tax=Neisseria sp. Marseille-Q2251 TaxID=2866585 RepID=UPI003139498D